MQTQFANNFPLPQVLWAIEVRVSGALKSVILVKRRTPPNFVLLLTLRGTHVRLIVVACHEPNEIGYAKINIEINSDTAVSSFFSFSDSVIIT